MVKNILSVDYLSCHCIEPKVVHKRLNRFCLCWHKTCVLRQNKLHISYFFNFKTNLIIFQKLLLSQKSNHKFSVCFLKTRVWFSLKTRLQGENTILFLILQPTINGIWFKGLSLGSVLKEDNLFASFSLPSLDRLTNFNKQSNESGRLVFSVSV